MFDSNNIENLLFDILPYVSKPSRYIGGEINSIRKKFDDVNVKIVLAFPDTYEIGMSYFGFQILYNILNNDKNILAERVYSPWVDMINIMEKHKIPLFTIESKTPIKDFDIIGFTLQYELHYTTILKMIELSGLNVKRVGRNPHDPIIIAGGPNAFNPEPMADFIDVFVIGDGEEIFRTIAMFIGDKKSLKFSNNEILSELVNFKGVYVPEFYTKAENNNFKVVPVQKNVPDKIESVIIPKLSKRFLPDKPIIPSMRVIQDRGIIEIMRGCTRGCRFCNAGYICRPTRERNISDTIAYTFEIIGKYGYEEISLLSLSISDYSFLDKFMEVVIKKSSKLNISFSFPSLRSDSFNDKMASFIKNVRKSGLTLAIEAAAERLRKVINKNICEEDLLNSVETAFKNGWMLIKLYFMIGLPTETDDDIIEIVNLAEKIINTGKPYGKVSINLSVAPFVPKSFTPFQWEKQDSIEELTGKIKLLRNVIRRKRLDKYINFKWRNPQISLLECIMGRGDRRLGNIIYSAYKKGALLEGWSDQFKFDIWRESFAENNIDPEEYSLERPIENPLPWEHISKGISKEFLLHELKKAYAGEYTLDCREDICYKCGIMGTKDCVININRNKRKLNKIKIDYENLSIQKNNQNEKVRLRICYRKEGFEVFLSHLDILNIFLRAVRVSGVRLSFTKGFNPHPKISFGPPLSTGYIGMNEFLDVFLEEEPDIDTFAKNIQKLIPSGITINNINIINIEIESISKSAISADYRIKISQLFVEEEAEKLFNLCDGFHLDKLYLIKNNKKIYLKKYVENIKYIPEKSEILLRINIINGSTLKVEEILATIFNRSKDEFLSFTIIREKINFK